MVAVNKVAAETKCVFLMVHDFSDRGLLLTRKLQNQ